MVVIFNGELRFLGGGSLAKPQYYIDGEYFKIQKEISLTEIKYMMNLSELDKKKVC